MCLVGAFLMAFLAFPVRNSHGHNDIVNLPEQHSNDNNG